MTIPLKCVVDASVCIKQFVPDPLSHRFKFMPQQTPEFRPGMKEYELLQAIARVNRQQNV